MVMKLDTLLHSSELNLPVFAARNKDKDKTWNQIFFREYFGTKKWIK